MNPKSKKLLMFGGIAAVGVFAIGWYLTSGSSSSSSAPQNAVNPNAQDAPGGPFAAQGTMPDIGNLLSYNQVPGATILTPQATSVDPFGWLAPRQLNTGITLSGSDNITAGGPSSQTGTSPTGLMPNQVNMGVTLG